jgi:hypothetical protein
VKGHTDDDSLSVCVGLNGRSEIGGFLRLYLTVSEFTGIPEDTVDVVAAFTVKAAVCMTPIRNLCHCHYCRLSPRRADRRSMFRFRVECVGDPILELS